MRTSIHRRGAAVLAAGASVLLGIALATTPAGVAQAAAAPAPVPAPPAEPAPALPPIALEPAGSAHTGPLIGIKADDGAITIAQKWLDSRTVDLTIRSPAVGADVVTRVMVPARWSQSSPSTYPLVLMLHGGNDNYTSWTRETTIEQLSQPWNVIVAMPDAGAWAAYTNFYNGGKFGTPAWETFHTVELLQILQRGMRAGPARAIAGLSNGGFGALSYAARNPQLFTFAGSYSGAISIRTSPMREAVLAADAVYPAEPFARFGVPIVDEKNWAAVDPYTNAAKLRGMSIFISSGYTGIPAPDDTVDWAPIQFVEVLSANVALQVDLKLSILGIPHTTDLYALGEHQWVSWQRELYKSWPQMMTALSAKKV